MINCYWENKAEDIFHKYLDFHCISHSFLFVCVLGNLLLLNSIMIYRLNMLKNFESAYIQNNLEHIQLSKSLNQDLFFSTLNEGHFCMYYSLYLKKTQLHLPSSILCILCKYLYLAHIVHSV